MKRRPYTITIVKATTNEYYIHGNYFNYQKQQITIVVPYSDLFFKHFSRRITPKRKEATTIMYPAANASAPVANTGPLLLGPENTNVDCPFCLSQIRTTVRYTEHTGTHIAAAIWGRLCCLCCIPYCSDSAKNADHYCPSCQKYLGTYRT